MEPADKNHLRPRATGQSGECVQTVREKAFLVTYRRKKTRAWILEKSVAAVKKAGIAVTI